MGCPNNLLTSFPINEHLVFPTVTPSALIIGIILNINLCLKRSAILSLLRRNFIIPWTNQEPLVSPGWTLPVIIITFFFYSSSFVCEKFVMVIKGTSIPPRLVVKLDVSTILNEFSLIVGLINISSSFFLLYS